MFKGSMAALVTPFKNGQVDEEALKELVELHVKSGTTALVPCGTTGESATLSYEEHDRVIELTIKFAGGRIPVIAGTGANSTEEAIMLTYDDHVAECTGDNIFIVKGSALITPPVDIGALEGITRDAVMGIARKSGIACHEKMLKMEDVYSADEVFLTGTAAEIIPVVRIDKRQIGNGKPGEVTLTLTEAFKKLTKSDGVRYDM